VRPTVTPGLHLAGPDVLFELDVETARRRGGG
jgi:hypothetical protein